MKTTALIIAFLCLVTLVACSLDEQPEAIYKVNPVYSQIAKDKSAEGKVHVLVTIDKAGLVTTAVVILSENPLLDEAALDAAVKWRFKPLSREMKATVPFNFKLAK